MVAEDVGPSQRLNLAADRGRAHYQAVRRSAPDFPAWRDSGAVVEDATTFYPFSNADTSALATGTEMVVMQDVEPSVPDMFERALERNDIPYAETDVAEGRAGYHVGTTDRGQRVAIYHGRERGDAAAYTPPEIEDGYEVLYWLPGGSIDRDVRDAARDRAEEYLHDEGLVIDPMG